MAPLLVQTLFLQMKSDWLWSLEASCKNLTVFPPVLKWKEKKESIKGVWFSNKPDFQFIWRAQDKGHHEPVSHQMFPHISAVVHLMRTQTKPHWPSPQLIFVIILSQADHLQIAPVPSPATNWGTILRNSLVLLALQFASCHIVIMPFSFQHNLLLPKWCTRRGVCSASVSAGPHEHFPIIQLHFLQQFLLYSFYHTHRHWMPLTSTRLPVTFLGSNPSSVPFP